MSQYNCYKYLLDYLLEVGNPIIQYNVLKMKGELTNDVSKRLIDSEVVNYWLRIFNGIEIHGTKDSAFENSIAKLLEFGLDRSNMKLDSIYCQYLEDSNWDTNNTFYSELMATVKYPFLIRAGYFNEPNVNRYFMERLDRIEYTIKKRGVKVELDESEKPKKYKSKFVFNIDIREEWLPTIYDLYGFSFIIDESKELKTRIEKVVEYILEEEFQSIPDKAYIYDNIKRRYFATGSVYHACFREERRLLMIYLLSNFKVAQTSHIFQTELDKLLRMKDNEGYFLFDKELIKEKKDGYFIYSGSHMGMGESRRSKEWLRIESTYWMLRILKNMDNVEDGIMGA